MKKQQLIIKTNDVNINLTIKKASEFKPRKDFKLVHMKYIKDVIPTADATHRILGLGYFWTENRTKELCYVIEIPANEATPINRMFENDKAEYRRAHRCKILNKKHTKLIMCPFSNSCSKCPYADHPEEIFPSEAEEHQEISFDEINEDKLSISTDSFGSAENMNLGLEMDEMMDELNSLEDKTLYNIATILNLESDINIIKNKLNDIKKQLNIDNEYFNRYITEYLNYYHKYID